MDLGEGGNRKRRDEREKRELTLPSLRERLPLQILQLVPLLELLQLISTLLHRGSDEGVELSRGGNRCCGRRRRRSGLALLRRDGSRRCSRREGCWIVVGIILVLRSSGEGGSSFLVLELVKKKRKRGESQLELDEDEARLNAHLVLRSTRTILILLVIRGRNLFGLLTGWSRFEVLHSARERSPSSSSLVLLVVVFLVRPDRPVSLLIGLDFNIIVFVVVVVSAGLTRARLRSVPVRAALADLRSRRSEVLVVVVVSSFVANLDEVFLVLVLVLDLVALLVLL